MILRPLFCFKDTKNTGLLIFNSLKQKKLIFNFFVNRNWKQLTDSRKRAKILADNRKSHHPFETLNLGPKDAPKTIYLRPPPPLSQGLDDWAPPLSVDGKFRPLLAPKSRGWENGAFWLSLGLYILDFGGGGGWGLLFYFILSRL